MNKLKMYILFLIGLFVSSFGVSLITKADLGTSPISAIPYVMSLGCRFTLGQFTVIFSMFLIMLQIFILRGRFKKEDLLQIPVSILFGYFIDLTMLLIQNFTPEAYSVKAVSLLTGCLILGFGVWLEVLANVVMLPGESFVRAVSSTWNTDFGATKVCFDASMTLFAGLISFLLFHTLNGVREGTIVAALAVGIIVKFFGKILGFLEPMLLNKEKTGAAE